MKKQLNLYITEELHNYAQHQDDNASEYIASLIYNDIYKIDTTVDLIEHHFKMFGINTPVKPFLNKIINDAVSILKMVKGH